MSNATEHATATGSKVWAGGTVSVTRCELVMSHLATKEWHVELAGGWGKNLLIIKEGRSAARARQLGNRLLPVISANQEPVRPKIRSLLAVSLAQDCPPVGNEKGLDLPAHPEGVGFERFLGPMSPRCGALAGVVAADQV